MSAPASLVATAFGAGSLAAFLWKAPARYEVSCPDVACGGCAVHCPPVSCSAEPVGSPGFWTGLLLGTLVGSLVVFVIAFGVVRYYALGRPATGQATEPATASREDVRVTGHVPEQFYIGGGEPSLTESERDGGRPATYAIRA